MSFDQGKNIAKCINIIKKGGVVAYPTDTVYGLGADIFNRAAVERIYSIKVREQNKPLLVNVGDAAQIHDYIEGHGDLEEQLMQEFWPGALTIIFKVNAKIPDYISRGSATMGMRVPDHPLALELLREYGRPLISTSINYSGDLPLLDDAGVRNNFSGLIDYLLGDNETCSGVPSTIVQVVDNKIRLLRAGFCDELLREKFLGAMENPSSAMD